MTARTTVFLKSKATVCYINNVSIFVKTNKSKKKKKVRQNFNFMILGLENIFWQVGKSGKLYKKKKTVLRSQGSSVIYLHLNQIPF